MRYSDIMTQVFDGVYIYVFSQLTTLSVKRLATCGATLLEEKVISGLLFPGVLRYITG